MPTTTYCSRVTEHSMAGAVETGNAQLEALRGHFARQLDPTKQQAVAREVQVRAPQVTRYVPLGQWYSLMAARSNIAGFLITPTIVF
jgi:hypothetical protein